MTKLSELFAKFVVPTNDDTLAQLLLKADVGARLVGALATSRLASDPSRRLPSALGTLLDKPTTGDWMWATRTAVLTLPETQDLSWRKLVRTTSEIPPRRIDGWLSPYEISLRHGGRVPPGTTEASHRLALARELRDLISTITVAGDPTISGHLAGTTAWGLPCAPFLERTSDGIRLWERQSRGKAEWRDLPSGRRVEAPLVEAQVGVWGALARARTGSLADWTGDREGQPLGAERGSFLVVTTPYDVEVTAQRLAEQLRSENRPVLPIRVGLLDAPIDQLTSMLCPVPEKGQAKAVLDPRSALAAWRGHRPILVFFGAHDPTSTATLAATGIEAAVWLVVPDGIRARWEPAERRHPHSPYADLVAADAQPSQDTSDDDWASAAAVHLGLEHRRDVELLIGLLSGGSRPLGGSQLGLTLWRRNVIEVSASGDVVLRESVWADFVDGLRQHPASENSNEAARAAGRAFRKRIGMESA